MLSTRPADHIPKPATSTHDIEQVITDVSASRAAWGALDKATKADLLRTCKKLCIDNFDAICQDAIKFKGSYGGGAGDEMYGDTHWLYVQARHSDVC